MLSHVALLLHAISPFLSDISRQDPISISLFTAVRNLLLTFLSVSLEGLKFQKFSDPLTLSMMGSVDDVIHVLSQSLIISTWTVKYALWILTHIRTLFSTYVTHNKNYKTIHCLVKTFLKDVYLCFLKSTCSAISSHHD